MTPQIFPELKRGTKGMHDEGGSNSRKAKGQDNALLTLFIHELRNPLATIRNAVEVLRRGGDDAATREWVESVLDRQTQQMTGLVEDMLELARVERGKIRLHKEPLNVAQVVSQAVEAVRTAVETRRHLLKIELVPEGTTLDADPTRLAQVLTNLLENAAKYTDPGGRIELSTVPEGNDIVFRVRDSGIGISPEMLPRIFDPFWQAPSAADHSAGGLGIGLSLVRQFVEMHGGTVTALSTGLGKGSEFVVRLPRTTYGDGRAGTPCGDGEKSP